MPRCNFVGPGRGIGPPALRSILTGNSVVAEALGNLRGRRAAQMPYDFSIWSVDFIEMGGRLSNIRVLRRETATNRASIASQAGPLVEAFLYRLEDISHDLRRILVRNVTGPAQCAQDKEFKTVLT